jgi:hypothetical protein
MTVFVVAGVETFWKCLASPSVQGSTLDMFLESRVLPIHACVEDSNFYGKRVGGARGGKGLDSCV